MAAGVKWPTRLLFIVCLTNKVEFKELRVIVYDFSFVFVNKIIIQPEIVASVCAHAWPTKLI